MPFEFIFRGKLPRIPTMKKDLAKADIPFKDSFRGHQNSHRPDNVKSRTLRGLDGKTHPYRSFAEKILEFKFCHLCDRMNLLYTKRACLWPFSGRSNELHAVPFTKEHDMPKKFQDVVEHDNDPGRLVSEIVLVE